MMFALLYDPLSEIRAVKRPSYSKVLLYLLTSVLFATVGVFFFLWRFLEPTTANAVSYVLFFLFGSLGALLVTSFFLSVALHVLDGKGGFYEGLAMVVLSAVAPSVMVFFAGAAAFVPFGIVVSCLLLSFGCVLGAATFFRAGKELFELDYAGVFIGLLIASMPFVCASLLWWLSKVSIIQ